MKIKVSYFKADETLITIEHFNQGSDPDYRRFLNALIAADEASHMNVSSIRIYFQDNSFIEVESETE